MAATDSRTAVGQIKALTPQVYPEPREGRHALAGPSPSTAIALHRVTGIRGGRRVLHNLDLTVDTGEMVACLFPIRTLPRR